MDSKSKQAMGFLTVVEHPQYGLFGGYLILNAAGRPLEFHCSAPIKPNRAQEILYGPTLGPFLYGEQIGRTLIAQGNATPVVVCTDREPALAAREFVHMPVVLVLSAEPASAQPPTSHDPGLLTFQLGRNQLAVSRQSEDDRRAVADQLAELAESFDLAEPFQRIRDAIEEAQQAVR